MNNSIVLNFGKINEKSFTHMKKALAIIFVLILLLTCFTNAAFADTYKNDDIKMSGGSALNIINSFETSWDNPNAWSLSDDADIVKVISTVLYDKKGKKIKSSSIDDSIRFSIHVPDFVREGYDEFKIVVFDKTAVREYIPCSYSDEWVSFTWNTVEDFGIVVPGASNGEAGAMTLYGSSRDAFYSLNFRKIFILVGISLVITIPISVIYAVKRTNREMREEYERKEELESGNTEDSAMPEELN